jgi:VWFA-related protein
MLLRFCPRLVALVLFVLALATPYQPQLNGQEAKPGAAASSNQKQPPASSQAVPTFRASTNVVTVDIVATDRHGQIVPDLTAKDFQVFEQIVGKKGQQEEHIAQFDFMTQAKAREAAKAAPKIPAGVYTNLIAMDHLPVPPTVLLVDGLNTNVEDSMQARRQMVKMLESIPSDTPTAVFLLGNRLQLVQGFTRDPALLRAAAQKAFSLDSAAMGAVDARDDPTSISQMTEEMFGAAGDEAPPGQAIAPGGASRGGAATGPSGPPGGELQIEAMERFEKENVSATIDTRVATTLDALRAIARHLSGYSGRKNLIWISSSFPITIAPDPTAQHTLSFAGNRNYSSEVAEVTNALADAKIAVYPVNPAGVQTQAYFGASGPARSSTYGSQVNTSVKNTLNRENEARFSSQESMEQVAEQTGGKICINNNDLADCVKTAVTEGSTYYELAYYPDTADWHGEFHRIVVKTDRPGVQLSYREGYYASVEGSVGKPEEKSKAKSEKGNDPQLEQAACADLLTATSILIVSKAYAGDQPGQAKFFMAIDSKMLTLAAPDVNSGSRVARLDLAVCALDPTGKPLQYMQDHVSQEVSAKDLANGPPSIQHMIQFAPNPGTARIRLVVRDVPTGRLGSVNVPYAAPGH